MGSDVGRGYVPDGSWPRRMLGNRRRFWLRGRRARRPDLRGVSGERRGFWWRGRRARRPDLRWGARQTSVIVVERASGADRKSVVFGKRLSLRVELVGLRILKKTTHV